MPITGRDLGSMAAMPKGRQMLSFRPDDIIGART